MDALSVVAFASSVGMQLGPWQSVARMRRAGSTLAYEPLPYTMNAANAVANTGYGLATGEPTLIWANAVASVLALGYLATYVGLADRTRRQVLAQVRLGALAVALAGGAVLLAGGATPQLQTAIGVGTNVIGIANFGAPLSTLSVVLATRNASSMPAGMVVANSATAAVWLLIGLRAADPFVVLPNVLGLALGLVQLGLLMAYSSPDGRKEDSSSSGSDSEESGADATL